MPWIFFTVSLVGLWYTANAIRPMRWPGWVALGSFFAGWLTSELALQHIAWQVFATGCFVAFGALEAWPGWVGLAACAVSWSGLYWCYRQSQRARTVLDDALREGLGESYLDEIDPSLTSSFDDSLEWGRLVRVFPIRRQEVDRVANVSFGGDDAKRLKLDIYRHIDKPTGCPTLLYIHGGGWVIGNKDQQGLVTMNHLASRGWVCVNANYRLSPRATFPQHLLDVKQAIRWVKEHVADYGGDPNFVIMAGGSAGGHLSSLAALTPNRPEYQPGFEDIDTSIQGCVPFYGIYDFTNRFDHWPHRGFHDLLKLLVMKKPLSEKDAYHEASPISHVGDDTPPFFLLHGDRDTLAPPAEARRFAEVLREKSPSPVCHAELPGAQHAFEIFPSVRSTHTVRAVERFCSHVYSKHLRQHDCAPGPGLDNASSASPDSEPRTQGGPVSDRRSHAPQPRG